VNSICRQNVLYNIHVEGAKI